MLVSSLRNIGLATMQNKDEIDVILEQQWNDIKKSKKILICNLDLDSRSLSLESIDNTLDNLRKVLPGLTSGSSQNFSPFVRIYHSVSQDDKRFFSLKPSTIVKFEKTLNFENSKSTEEIASKFGIWLKRNKEILQENILKHFEEYYLTKSDKDELVIMRDAPLYLSFKIKTRGGFRYIGDIPDFERMYLSRKHASQNSAKIKNNLPNSICIVCGENKTNLLSLQSCKYLDLFSLDQASFQLQFQGEKSSLQALICSDCEITVRKGYTEVNTTLKFLAYKRVKSQKKTHYIYHSLIPLYSVPSNINHFLLNVTNYRKAFFDSKKKSFQTKISALQEVILKADRMKRKTLDKQIKNLEKQRIDTEEKGFIQGSEDTNYIDILKEAKSRNVGIMDFFYREEMVVGKKKKVIEDVFYGDKQRISMIVEWFEQISEKYIDTKFDIGKLMHTFGEKTGRQILQSLFTSKSLDENHLYKSAYETLWNNFRKTLVSNEEDKGKYRYFVREGIKQFHYVFDLLNLAKLLG